MVIERFTRILIHLVEGLGFFLCKKSTFLWQRLVFLGHESISVPQLGTLIFNSAAFVDCPLQKHSNSTQLWERWTDSECRSSWLAVSNEGIISPYPGFCHKTDLPPTCHSLERERASPGCPQRAQCPPRCLHGDKRGRSQDGSVCNQYGAKGRRCKATPNSLSWTS